MPRRGDPDRSRHASGDTASPSSRRASCNGMAAGPAPAPARVARARLVVEPGMPRPERRFTADLEPPVVRPLPGSPACAWPAGRSPAAAGPARRAQRSRCGASSARPNVPIAYAAHDCSHGIRTDRELRHGFLAVSRPRCRAPCSPDLRALADVTSRSRSGTSSSRSCGLSTFSRNSSALSCTTGCRTAARRTRCAGRTREQDLQQAEDALHLLLHRSRRPCATGSRESIARPSVPSTGTSGSDP